MSTFFPYDLDELRVLEPDSATAAATMPRQNTFDEHGHDMHPQALPRLIGCQNVAGQPRLAASEVMAQVISGC